MASRILTENIWPTITSTVKRYPKKCQVSVAYFGNGASKLLPLEEGSLLVVDMSEKAVKSGQTRPQEVLRLIKKGVSVHSISNLHAKVFAFPKRAFVGSTNASQNSAKGLVEAVVEVSDAKTVAGCRRFVQELQGEPLTPEYTKRMEKLYRPPKFGNGAKQPQKVKDGERLHAPLWAVPLARISWDKEERQEVQQGRPEAQAALRTDEKYFVSPFIWEGGTFARSIKENDLIVQVMEERNGQVMFSPAYRVLSVRRYRSGRKTKLVVYLEAVRNVRRKSLSSVVEKLGSAGKALGKAYDPIKIRDAGLAHKLLGLWSRNGAAG